MSDTAAPAVTIDDMVRKAIELDDYISAETKAHDERMKPYRDGLNAIKAATLAHLQAQKQQNAKTESGTAYQQTTMSVKVDDREKFLDFIDGQEQWSMLDAGALKAPVETWINEHNGEAPPGISVSFFTKCNIRRS